MGKADRTLNFGKTPCNVRTPEPQSLNSNPSHPQTVLLPNPLGFKGLGFEGLGFKVLGLKFEGLGFQGVPKIGIEGLVIRRSALFHKKKRGGVENRVRFRVSC